MLFLVYFVYSCTGTLENDHAFLSINNLNHMHKGIYSTTTTTTKIEKNIWYIAYC